MQRIPELDYLKGILILLVISFHLVYFEQLYPYAKQVVYTFHMPGFLLISGYLMNVSKAPKDFMRTLLWLAIPYLFMASGYIYVASLLPINDHIDNLTPLVFLDRLLLQPLGPPWYLHTLLICGSLYYLIINSKFKIQNSKLLLPLQLLLIGIAYYAVSYVLGTLLPLYGIGGSFSFSSSLYFLAGAVLRQSGTNFLTFFRPFKGHWGGLSLLAFALLACFSINPNQGSLNGALIVYFAISSLLWLYGSLPPRAIARWQRSDWGEPRSTEGKEVWRGAVFLGRNSLVLYVFSPIFTVLCKRFVPYLQFDPTGLIFLFVSLVFCVAGSLGIAWLLDFTHTSRFIFGRKALSLRV